MINSNLRKYINLKDLYYLYQKKKDLPNGEASFSKEDIDKLNFIRKILVESYIFNQKQTYVLLISDYLSEKISINEFKIFFLQSWLIDHEDAKDFEEDFSHKGLLRRNFDTSYREQRKYYEYIHVNIANFLVPNHPKVSIFCSYLQYIAELCYAIDEHSYSYIFSSSLTDGPEARKDSKRRENDKWSNLRLDSSITDLSFQAYIKSIFTTIEFEPEDNFYSEDRPTYFDPWGKSD